MRWNQVLVGEECLVEVFWFVEEIPHHGNITLAVGSLIISFYIYDCWIIEDRVKVWWD